MSDFSEPVSQDEMGKKATLLELFINEEKGFGIAVAEPALKNENMRLEMSLILVDFLADLVKEMPSEHYSIFVDKIGMVVPPEPGTTVH